MLLKSSLRGLVEDSACRDVARNRNSAAPLAGRVAKAKYDTMAMCDPISVLLLSLPRTPLRFSAVANWSLFDMELNGQPRLWLCN